MPLFVNKEKIDEMSIKHEMDRMRDNFKKMYPEKKEISREKTLFDWAKENLIERILLKQYAENKNVRIPVERIDKELKKIKKNFDNYNEFSEYLAHQGSSLQDIKHEIREKLMIDEVLESLKKLVKKPTQQSLNKYFCEHRDRYVTPEYVRVKHIVKHVGPGYASKKTALQKIRKAHKELETGKNFENVGNKYSDCPGEGLDLGYFTYEEMVPAFEKIAFSLQKGEVSEIFQTEFGYQIAKLYDKKSPRKLTFEEVKKRLVKDYQEDAVEKKMNNFVDELKSDASIEYVETEKITESAKAGFILKKFLNFVLVKPSGPDCNLSCEYCFYLEKEKLYGHKKHRMSDKVLKEMIRKTVKNNPSDINFGWQGGEPTLMGIDFFKQAVQYQREYSGPGQNVGNSIQTNGILIDEEWAGFLKNNNFLVGLSVDGPENIHDTYRKTRGGKGTFSKVEKTAELLLRNNVPVNSLTVLNNYSVRFPEQIYHYLTSLGFRFLQFIPVVETDTKNKRAASFSTTGEQYGKFLCRIFDLWKNDFQHGRPTVSVRFFDSVFFRYINQEAPDCFLHEECGTYFVIEHNGDVYSCDFFVEPKWKLGNIINDDPLLMLNSDKQKQFGMIKKQLPVKCKECPWVTYCRGGCTKDRIKDPQDKNLNHFCTGYTMFFEYADSFMKQLADEFLSNQRAQNRPATTVNQSDQEKSRKKIRRNDPCPCGSGKKYKNCCGKN